MGTCSCSTNKKYLKPTLKPPSSMSTEKTNVPKSDPSMESIEFEENEEINMPEIKGFETIGTKINIILFLFELASN